MIKTENAVNRPNGCRLLEVGRFRDPPLYSHCPAVKSIPGKVSGAWMSKDARSCDRKSNWSAITVAKPIFRAIAFDFTPDPAITVAQSHRLASYSPERRALLDEFLLVRP